ncbi:response regulator transcription factor [Dokdonia sp. Hel_I_53]|uniref:response regulator transcription factor n=1 Tax=Dokdonia sp. Hel_I_53 TaxID=1566287 RepID=UPI00119A24D8|nr:response regulator transcription factor [Dokdonia sp. Hel_I_53]TVZ51269.1 two-component system nitrate/nitrite response regulator NarL [Dokdonia sp. Hel_I_53]
MIPIAIAEDHQALLDGIQLLFKYNQDISIIGMANDGEELLDIVRKKQPKIIITDIRMPRMDGITMTKIISNEFPHIRTIAFSMFDQDAAIEQMRDAGASGYVLKTSPLDTLETAIHTVLNGQEFYDATLVPNTPNASVKNYKSSSVLSKSEREILKLIAQNMTSSEIASIRFTAVSTVDKHRKNMMRKLNLSGKGELLRYALETKYDF